MKKQNIFLIITLAIMIVFTGCGAKSYSEEANGYVTDDAMAFSEESISVQTAGSANNFGFAYQTYDAEMPETELKLDGYGERKIIYSCSFDIQTTDFDTSYSLLNALCEKYGAYYERSECNGTKEKENRYATYTIRVPVQNYKNFQNESGSIGVVIRSYENNNDVTDEYFDTEARLESAKIREERLLEILKKADTLENVLLLEQELSDVRYEIESMSGTLKKYDSLISYSTVHITLDEVVETEKIQPKPKSFGEKMSNAITDGFEDFTETLGNFVIDLTYNLPGIIIFAAIVIIIVIIIKKTVKKIKNKIKKEDNNSK